MHLRGGGAQVPGVGGEVVVRAGRVERDAPRVARVGEELLHDGEVAPCATAGCRGVRPRADERAVGLRDARRAGGGDRGLQHDVRVLPVVERTEHLHHQAGLVAPRRRRAHDDRGVRLLAGEHLRAPHGRRGARPADALPVRRCAVARQQEVAEHDVEQGRHERRVVRAVGQPAPADSARGVRHEGHLVERLGAEGGVPHEQGPGVPSEREGRFHGQRVAGRVREPPLRGDPRRDRSDPWQLGGVGHGDPTYRRPAVRRLRPRCPVADRRRRRRVPRARRPSPPRRS